MPKPQISRDNLRKDLLSLLSKKEIAEKYGLSFYKLQKMLKTYGLKRPIEISNKIRIARQQKTNTQKYGSTSPFANHEVRVKSKLTLAAKYGVSNPSQISAVMDKRTQTNLNKYGTTNPLLNPDVKAKALKTLRTRYGTDNPNTLDEIKHKIIATNLKKRGVKFVMQDPIVRANSIITKLERSGQLSNLPTKKDRFE